MPWESLFHHSNFINATIKERVFSQLILSKCFHYPVRNWQQVSKLLQRLSQNLSCLEQQKQSAIAVIIGYATTQKGRMVCIGHFSSHPLC